MNSSVYRLFYLYILVGFLPLGFAANSNEDWSNYSRNQIEEINQKSLLDRKTNEMENLILAKKFLVNGDTEWAKYFLNKINTNESSLLLVTDRYKAWIAFIEGDYEKTLKILEKPKFRYVENFKEVCLLKVLSKMTGKYTKSVEQELNYCSLITRNYSNNEQYWLDNLNKLKTGKFKDIKGMNNSDIQYIVSDSQLVRIWLKTGLYMNREDLIEKHITGIPSSVYKSKRTRELIGFYHYRKGEFAKAKDFVEDIETTNAENIRGNINLKEKKYELAFGHFKLALNKKANSLNALERAIPLAWILEQWRDGLELIGRLVTETIDPQKKDALESAFHIRMENYSLANRKLRILDAEYQGQPPLEVDIMRSYVALRNHDPRTLFLTSKNSCRRYDGLNCWLQHQQIIWENIGKTVDRDEKILGDQSLDMNSLKIYSPPEPLQENIYIDQKDIEELDSQLIKVGTD
ncbi:MAG: hypothetical protein KC493_13670 [Bacteriovoracaceae bacterium]|nr:hypothetical protein [Bacteriovoracaceae bacterium]